MKIIKRSGKEVDFDKNKIINAISKANNEVTEDLRMGEEVIDRIADHVTNTIKVSNYEYNVEDIQDLVELEIMKNGWCKVAQKYIKYREKRTALRRENTIDKNILTLIDGDNENVKQENSNKNPIINSTQRDYMAGEVSKDISRRYILPEDIVRANDSGIIHLHDLDYLAQHSHNCCVFNLEDMLQNGTVISNTMIEKPKSFATACNIATQCVAQIASSQYGGQTFTLSHLAPFVDISRQKYYKEVKQEAIDAGIEYTKSQLDKIVEDRVKKEIKTGVQMIQYQILTLMTCNGQAPFVSIFMYLNEVKDETTKNDLAMIIEEVLKQRILGVKNEAGQYRTPAFPKLLYVLEEDNITKDSKYWYLTELAAKCTAKRMVPDYISEKIMKENKEGNVFPCMGCRSFLSPWKDENGEYKFYGRFNQGVVTLNLVDIACSSGGDFDKFWKLMDERLNLCYRALMIRHNRLKGTKSDVAPILWQYGALARLDKGEPIDKLLYNGYSTISLGYAGLYECTYYMTGESHTNPNKGKEFAIKVMKALNDACEKWKEETTIGFSVYGTPLESTTYEFARKLKERFGIIKEVTDHSYITNSFHVNVREKIDAFTKLIFESEFQKYSLGGTISYVETPNLQSNIEAIESVIQFIYDNIMYAELNTKSDVCQVCNYEGEIELYKDEESGKFVWKCPNCGNTDQNKMNVARRTCGYIGENFWNFGRTEEIADRVLHL